MCLDVGKAARRVEQVSADHRVVGEARRAHAAPVQLAQHPFGIVGPQTRSARKERFERGTDAVVLERVARERKAPADRRAEAERTAGEGQRGAPFRTDRANLAGETLELRRIRRRCVVAVLAFQFRLFFEERKIRRRLQLGEQRFELELAVEGEESDRPEAGCSGCSPNPP